MPLPSCWTRAREGGSCRALGYGALADAASAADVWGDRLFSFGISIQKWDDFRDTYSLSVLFACFLTPFSDILRHEI